MDFKPYHENIIAYYRQTINSYKDAWNMDKSMAMHYGYWDDEVNSFEESLARMNSKIASLAEMKINAEVLDAGCGVGGSSFYLAQAYKSRCIGISLSEEQLKLALQYRNQLGLQQQVQFEVMDYANTSFEDERFDVVWACESVCHADNKREFLKEVYRLLRPGGVFVMADGMVTNINNNQHPTIRKWLDGWMVNYLETPENLMGYGQELGFTSSTYEDISANVWRSSRRLMFFFFLGKLAILHNRIFGKRQWTAIQTNNINACWHQYQGLRKGLWTYGLIKMVK